jgi:hypothetical protein
MAGSWQKTCRRPARIELVDNGCTTIMQLVFAFSAIRQGNGVKMRITGRGFNHFALIVNKLNIKAAVRQLFALTL